MNLLFLQKPGLRHQMATVQPEGTNAISCQTSQIIPVITTEVTDETNSINDREVADKSKFDTDSDQSSSRDSSSVIGIKSNTRARQSGRAGGGHGERRYHTTGVIEGIKVIHNLFL